MTNREYLLAHEDAEFVGELATCENKLISDYVICGMINNPKVCYPLKEFCWRCQLDWLDAEHDDKSA